MLVIENMLFSIKAFQSGFFSLVYIEQGRSTTATTLTFTTVSTTGITWRAKVTQVGFIYTFWFSLSSTSAKLESSLVNMLESC